ncbi:MAG: lysostaphin resistance A-like protein [Acidimicrobiales bacterium]
MARQRGAASTVLVADDWSTVWRCGCGYGNAGRERCLVCGAKAPDEALDTPGLHAEEEVMPKTGPRLDERAGRKAVRMIFQTIGLNIAMQAVVAGFLLTNGVDRATFIKISLYSGIVYFTLIAIWALGKAAVLGVQPVLGKVNGLKGAAEGFVVGGATAILLVAGVRVAIGRPLLDPMTTYIAAEGSILGIVIGVLAIVCVGPAVEELVFRGFLAETFLQRWGKATAVLVSAACFSLAHLRLWQFWYFALIGVGFGLIYLRRGLVGSIAAHATFNGMLVLLAVAAMHGEPLDVTVGGTTVAIPPTWHVVVDDLYQDFAAVGPLGAQVGFYHQDLPVVPSAEMIAQVFVTGGIPLPEGASLDAATVNMLDLPAGRAVSLIVEFEDTTGRLVALPTPGRLWMAVFESDGTSRSSFEFDDMLRSWRVPAPAAVAS